MKSLASSSPHSSSKANALGIFKSTAYADTWMCKIMHACSEAILEPGSWVMQKVDHEKKKV